MVAANKYTGAAAVAELCCRSLLEARVDARLLFVAGNNLARRLRGEPWALPALVKERGLPSLRANLAALAAAGRDADAVLCHLPHDHLLAVLAGVHRRALLVRAFRHPRHLRRDPFHRRLARPLGGALLAHPGLSADLRRVAPALEADSPPVPLEDRFRPSADAALWRRRLDLPAAAPVLGMVGKLARNRGFELLLETAARVSPPPHLLVVGHGEAAAELERRGERLGLADRVAWAGYQERELPELYATMDVVLFAAAGSDHGHRAVSEAQGCGRPVVAAALPGVAELIDDRRTGRVVAGEPGALARAVSELLADHGLADRVGRAAAAAVEGRRFMPVGRRLAAFLEGRMRARRGER